MAPPAAAALALLGVWVLVTLWATTAAARGQARADDRLGIEKQSKQSLEEPPSFSTADNYVPAFSGRSSVFDGEPSR